MAALRIVRDPIASDSAADVPRQQWDVLMEERKRFCTQYLPKDCRNLLFFVEDGAANDWLEYGGAKNYIRSGLGLDPQMVDWAVTGLRNLRPGLGQIKLEVAALIGKIAKHGGDRRSLEALKQGGLSTLNGRKNTRAHWLGRLRRDRPDLAAKVDAGELSAKAAAIECGFKKRTIEVPADPDAAVAALIRKFGIAAVLAAIKAQST